MHDCPRPINLPIARQPVQQGEMDQLPGAGDLFQSRNRGRQVMPEPQPRCCGSISGGIPLREDEQNPRNEQNPG